MRDDAPRRDRLVTPLDEEGRYEPWPAGPRGGDPAVAPARDTLSGARVSVLQAAAAPTTHETLERLRAWTQVRHEHLAEVRAVEPVDERVLVVCEPLHGRPVLGQPDPPVVTVRAVHRLSAQLLGAVAALHRAGLVHGALTGQSVLLTRDGRIGGDVDLTLLPVPVATGTVATGTAATDRGRDDDVAAAAGVLLGLLRRSPVGGLEESVLAAALTRELERALRAPGSPPPER